MPDTRKTRYLMLRLPVPVRVALNLGIGALIVAALVLGREILVPLALAGLLAFLLDPLVGRLRRWRVSRGLAVALVTLATLATVAGASLVVGQQVMQLGRNLPQYQSTIETKLRHLRQSIVGERSLSSASRLIGAVENEVAKTRQALQPAAAAGDPTRRAEPLRVKVAAAELGPLETVNQVVTPLLSPLITGGIAIVLLVFILLERNDIRDRVMRLTGGDLHDMTDALNEAAHRVSRYLSMQVLVNLCYGLPLALGLWAIGVPGAWLWGLLAGVMRFVPYVGPVVASLFPLTLAFAVDPGWDMLLWTLSLVLVLELISNNVVEPWLYGSSTGLAPVAVLLSAAFWTVLWGPVGLVLATPLTVCLVVMGRHLPSLRFLDLLLGSDPVFDPATRLYQRLLAGNVMSAIEIADAQIDADGLTAFYSATALPALALAAVDHGRVSSAEHRLRVRAGMAELLRELRAEHSVEPPPAALDTTAGDPSAASGVAAVACIGLRWEADTLAADMLAHGLSAAGVPSLATPEAALNAERIARLDLQHASVVCLSTFHPDPEAMVRYACRRLRRARPDLKIVLGLWNAPAALHEPGAAATLGAAAVATSLAEAVERVRALSAPADPPAPAAAGGEGEPADEPRARAHCLRIDAWRQAPARQAAQRSGEVFDTDEALVCWVDGQVHRWRADGAAHDGGIDAQAWWHQLPLGDEALVVPDLARDGRFGADGNGAQLPHRFMAAAPLRWTDGSRLGMLCVLDRRPRPFGLREQQLLTELAAELIERIEVEGRERSTPAPARPDPPLPAAATA